MSLSKTPVGLLLATTLALMSFASTAYPDQKGGHGGKTCKADVEQFCSQVNPGEGRLLACLKGHQSQLQPACQEKLPLMEKSQQMKQTCQVDRKKFCAQAEGKKEVRACMKKNHDLLSEPCRAAIVELKSLKKSHRRPDPLPASESKPAPSATHWDTLRQVYI